MATQRADVPNKTYTKARCPPEKPANATTIKNFAANKNTGNFQVDTGHNLTQKPMQQ